jgi:hypothetical protein
MCFNNFLTIFSFYSGVEIKFMFGHGNGNWLGY